MFTYQSLKDSAMKAIGRGFSEIPPKYHPLARRLILSGMYVGTSMAASDAASLQDALSGLISGGYKDISAVTELVMPYNGTDLTEVGNAINEAVTNNGNALYDDFKNGSPLNEVLGHSDPLHGSDASTLANLGGEHEFTNYHLPEQCTVEKMHFLAANETQARMLDTDPDYARSFLGHEARRFYKNDFAFVTKYTIKPEDVNQESGPAYTVSVEVILPE